MEQCLIFCRTNYDCDNLERFLNELSGGSGSGFRGMRESGKEGKYSCVVLAGQRSMEERRRALQVGCSPTHARGVVKELSALLRLLLVLVLLLSAKALLHAALHLRRPLLLLLVLLVGLLLLLPPLSPLAGVQGW